MHSGMLFADFEAVNLTGDGLTVNIDCDTTIEEISNHLVGPPGDDDMSEYSVSSSSSDANSSRKEKNQFESRSHRCHAQCWCNCTETTGRRN